MDDKANIKRILTPFVYWAQKENIITLNVDLKDLKNADIEIKGKSLKFSTIGCNEHNTNDYKFTLDLYSDIDDKESNYEFRGSKIDIKLVKKESSWWPRLIAQPQKPHWLKIDFDRWKSEDDFEEEPLPRNIMEDYPGLYDMLEKEEYGYKRERFKEVYLVLYNLCQFIGFLYIFIVMCILYYRDGKNSMQNTYESVGNAMKFCQLLQYLEVMHPIFGYTKGGAIVPFMQVTGRNFVLFLMIDAEPRMQTKPVVFYLFFVWTAIEIIRYPYYISTIINRTISILTWLRYTIWIPLYPMGIICEGVVILRNIPYFEETKRFSIELPNKWNFAFCMPTFLKLYILVLIIPGSYFLITYMAKTRAKKLGVKKQSLLHKNY